MIQILPGLESSARIRSARRRSLYIHAEINDRPASLWWHAKDRVAKQTPHEGDLQAGIERGHVRCAGALEDRRVLGRA